MLTPEKKREIVSNWLSAEGNNFCAMPYIHLAIEGNGAILPCCMGSPITDVDGKLLHIGGSTIDSVFNSDSRRVMIQSFDQNQQYANCKHCWTQSDKLMSSRVKYSVSPYAIDFTYTVMNGYNPSPKLTWLEIKPGNRCNLKCRICGVHNSSSWAADTAKLYHPETPYKQTETYKYMKQCEWINSDTVWSDVSGLSSLECIHIMGGEPFMIHEHFEFLQRYVDQYDTSKVTLWYNTNGTFNIPDRYLNIFEKMKRVQLSISIDDVGKRFEYQRKNANWNETIGVVNNLFSLKMNNVNVVLDPTVSIYNLYYLDEFITVTQDLGWGHHMSPSHFVDGNQAPNNIRTLSLTQKKHIVDHLNTSKHFNSKLIQNSIAFMSEDQWSIDVEMKRTNLIKKLDSMRSERFDVIFPEMNNILGVYFE